MSGNDQQEQLDNDLEQEQQAMSAQQATLQKRQQKIVDAEMQNLKRTEGAGMTQASMSATEDEEETLG